MADKLTSTPRNTHDISGAGDRYEALVELLEHQASQSARDRALELEQLRRSRERRGPRPYWLLGVMAFLLAWVWLLPPAFLRTDPPPPQPLEQEEAALRFAIYVQAQRIAAYRAETREYPVRLEEAGPPLPDMQYTRLAAGLYQLTGETDRIRLTYRSDLPLEGFVRSGADVIERGARPARGESTNGLDPAGAAGGPEPREAGDAARPGDAADPGDTAAPVRPAPAPAGGGA